MGLSVSVGYGRVKGEVAYHWHSTEVFDKPDNISTDSRDLLKVLLSLNLNA